MKVHLKKPSAHQNHRNKQNLLYLLKSSLSDSHLYPLPSSWLPIPSSQQTPLTPVTQLRIFHIEFCFVWSVKKGWMETWPPLIYFRMSGSCFTWCLRSYRHISKFPSVPLGQKMLHSSQPPWRFSLLFLALLFLLEFRRELHVVLYKIGAWAEFSQQGILWFSNSWHLIWPLKCTWELPLLSEQILSPVLHFPHAPTIFGAALLTAYSILRDALLVPPSQGNATTPQWNRQKPQECLVLMSKA